MMVIAVRRALTLLSLLAALLWSVPLHAQETTDRAGLVVVHEDGTVVTRCIGLAAEESSISGLELLQRSGLDLYTDAGGVGTSICRLDGQGCGPEADCFCQCQSSDCRYWSYWQLDGAEWRYANLGASATTVAAGSVEGWVWGAGEMGDVNAGHPPPMSLAEICPADAVVYGPEGISAPALGLNLPIGALAWVLGGPLLLVGGGWLWRRRTRRLRQVTP